MTNPPNLAIPSIKPWSILPAVLFLSFPNVTTSEPLYKTPLNDTGMIFCTNDPDHSCPIPGQPKDDSDYGRDKTHNDNTDGYAGFSLTKISRKGKALAAKARTWRCVQDNVTGLMWEVKSADKNLHDRRWTYSWYEPNNQINGGDAGVRYGGKCRRKRECDTYAYVEAVNKRGWCGYKDWRMPTLEELINFTSFIGFNGYTVPDVAYFPDARNVNLIFWSATASHSPDAALSFSSPDLTSINEAQKHEKLRVRLVRGGR